MDLAFNFFSNYLIEFMGALLVVGLGFRWASYRSSVKDDSYFSNFTTEIEKTLLLRKEKGHDKIEDVDQYLAELLQEVEGKLPNRSVRNKKRKSSDNNVITLREYVKGDQGLFLGIKNESAAFKSKFPPNFNTVTERILEQDDNWNKLLYFFPIGPISRLIDILPGLFVVFGIFGTFIGISLALPQIAEMDFNNLEGSGAILTSFVLAVTYAMKTSIAGILFNVIMIVLNTAAPVTGLRKRTFKKINSCLENIWQTIHGEKSLEEEIHEVLPALLEEVKALRKEVESNGSYHKEKKGA
jgi:hypothetical protein